jgi:predicted DNA-binding transcriptional regulator YafY
MPIAIAARSRPCSLLQPLAAIAPPPRLAAHITIRLVDRTERFYKIQQLINRHKVVPARRFRDELEISPATFKRDLEYLRSRLNIPIIWDREANGYRYDPQAALHELPGLWFNAQEIHALLTMKHLLENLEPGLLGPHVEPLLDRLSAAIGSGKHPAAEVQKRIRILQMARRSLPLKHFEMAARGLLERRRLRIVYYNRSRGDETTREVSPQRLVHYRENWYLDAWCHLREDIRSFAVDAIRVAEIMPQAAIEVPARQLDEVLASGYGIFSGRHTQRARLRFSPLRARWVASEQWHPAQRAEFDADGSYLLEIPYSDDRELIMDILKYGPDVEVLDPPALRQRVQAALAETLQRYLGERSAADRNAP